MKRLILYIIAMLFGGDVFAQCPAADVLIDEYGISFSGFKKKLPRTSQPGQNAQGNEELISIPLRNKNGFVPDGFAHTAVINNKQKLAWILRTGGFVSVYEWYGPVGIHNIDFSGCNPVPFPIKIN